MALFDTRRMAKFPVFLRGSGEFIGTCGLEPADIEGQAGIELGYRLCLNYWGHGYAQEAAQAVLRCGVDELKLPIINAFVLPQNRAPVKIFENLGFQFEREFLQAEIPHRLYAITRSQLPSYM